MAISLRLAAQDPSNADWQRDLAVTCVQLGRLLANEGRHVAALPLYEEASRIYGALSKKAPGHAEWGKEKDEIEAKLTKCRLMIRAAKALGSAPLEDSSGGGGK